MLPISVANQQEDRGVGTNAETLIGIAHRSQDEHDQVFLRMGRSDPCGLFQAAGLLSPTLHALRNIGFIEAAKKGDITFVVFDILGPSIASLDEIVDTAAYLGDAKYFLVKNFINNTHSVALQPLSVQGQVGLNAAGGIGALELHYAQ